MNPIESLVPHVLTGVSIVLAVTIFLTFLRTIIGPRMSDRIIAVNMIGTQAILLIACLSIRLHESWIVDVGIIYAMFSFLAVVVLTKMDIGAYREWRANQKTNSEQNMAARKSYKESEQWRVERQENRRNSRREKRS